MHTSGTCLVCMRGVGSVGWGELGLWRVGKEKEGKGKGKGWVSGELERKRKGREGLHGFSSSFNLFFT